MASWVIIKSPVLVFLFCLVLLNEHGHASPKDHIVERTQINGDIKLQQSRPVGLFPIPNLLPKPRIPLLPIPIVPLPIPIPIPNLLPVGPKPQPRPVIPEPNIWPKPVGPVPTPKPRPVGPVPTPKPRPVGPVPTPKPRPVGPVPRPKPKPKPKPIGPKPVGPKPNPSGPKPKPTARGVFVDMPWEGKWNVTNSKTGVSAMHMQLMPDNRVLIFDATSGGKSLMNLPPNNCRPVPQNPKVMDCFAHSIEYNLETDQVRPLKVLTDSWCSSGGLAADGTFVGTGGYKDGGKTQRYFSNDPKTDWRESKIQLSDVRWYATQTILAKGDFLVMGGRRAFNYEFVAPEGKPSPGKLDFPFLKETTDLYENNLYPFLHLMPDGNLFILANNKAIHFNPYKNQIIRRYPDMPGGARNYPGSGSSAILPLKIKPFLPDVDVFEILVCGGSPPQAFGLAEKKKMYLPALDNCGRIKPMEPNPKWITEPMPGRRVMASLHNLPNGELLFVQGAKNGSSGWTYAEEPVFEPWLYSPNKPWGKRWRVLAPSTIARMYHSTSAVLPDGRIIVGGSNTNPRYLFGVKYPTELRIEMYYPPYLDPALENLRPMIGNNVPKRISYKAKFTIPFSLDQKQVFKEDLLITMYRPPFNTHAYSMDQRSMILPIINMVRVSPQMLSVDVGTPSKQEIAPAGYHLVYVNYKGVPSPAIWVQLL